MIIINQYKDIIINFDNVEFITKNNNSPCIYARTNKAEIMIGKYKNEERALEVLDEISEIYCLEKEGNHYSKFIMPEN